jgi:hypothetical protein
MMRSVIVTLAIMAALVIEPAYGQGTPYRNLLCELSLQCVLLLSVLPACHTESRTYKCDLAAFTTWNQQNLMSGLATSCTQAPW